MAKLPTTLFHTCTWDRVIDYDNLAKYRFGKGRLRAKIKGGVRLLIARLREQTNLTRVISTCAFDLFATLDYFNLYFFTTSIYFTTDARLRLCIYKL